MILVVWFVFCVILARWFSGLLCWLVCFELLSCFVVLVPVSCVRCFIVSLLFVFSGCVFSWFVLSIYVSVCGFWVCLWVVLCCGCFTG